MKNSPFFGRKQAPRRRGIALVIVLGFLVLITVLIVAYFTSVTNEYSTTKTYANGTTAKFLSDSAVNIVMGQIAKGTQGQGTGGTRLTWASQPGMIHTWTDQGIGYAASAGDCYKLYSSGTMVVPGATWSAEVAQAQNGGPVPDVPTNWSSQPALYTDLNAPVIDASGSANFPIIDGNNMIPMTSQALGAKVLTYHSQLNSSLTPDIEGFSVLPSYVPNYSSSKPLSATNTPVPMPAQWLYTLKDGSVIAPDANGNGATATFNQAATKPSAANPIVGRIAFWTDDETCKLNINTASEGTYYSMPHANTNTDMQSAAKSGTFGFAVTPPGTGEYNRYPGHPATTCLSVAMGTWMNSLQDKEAPNAYSSTSNDQAYLKDLTNYLYMVPRTGTGGSLAGTYPVTTSTSNVVTSSTASRLYASFDEAMFNPSRGPNVAAANPGTLTKPELEELKFFLTANSRAPELTPFNTPKVSLWPQWSATSDRQQFQGPTEQLLAFCSSFGPHGANSSSASTQFEYFWEWGISNQQWEGNPYWALYNINAYNSTLDWSGTNGNTYGSKRNQAMATYLCNLGNHPVPGYGKAFRSSQKYSDRCFSNIVVDCLDFIRTCVDRIDYIAPAAHATSPSFGDDAWGALVPPLLVADNTLPGVTKNMPVKGFGFTEAFSKVALGATLQTSGTQSYYVPTLTFEGYIPTWAFPAGQPQQETIALSWNSLNNLGITTTDPAPPNGQWTVGVFMTIGIGWGPGQFQWSYAKNDPVYPFGVTLSHWRFKQPGTFASGTASAVALTMGGGGPLQFSIVDNYGTPYQNESVTFPRVTIQMPAGKPKYSSVSRSMDCNANTVAKGDYRILAGTVNISSGAVASSSGTTGPIYSQCAGYGGMTYSTGTAANVNAEYLYCRNTTQAVGVRTSIIAGTLAPVVSGTTAILSSSDYGDVAAPLAPPGVQGTKNFNGSAGDWDTGAGAFPDGPWVGARDQGDVASEQAYWPSGDSWGGDTRCFSPNRRIASAIQFGSIPSGISASPAPRPWETLLFCPNPAARTASFPPGADTSQDSEHIGFANPPDHLLADFFTMPVVQPYAISEPLSTAGKVNLNYQIAPFTSIERSTALRGVLKSTLMAGISGYDVKSQTYKSNSVPPPANVEIRYDINRDATVAGIDEHYFNKGNIFRYPSEICDVFLVPTYLGAAQPFLSPPSRPSFYNSQSAPVPTTYDKMLAWWNPSAGGDPLSTMCMTGDNLREEPYDRLYPRLTTQSNTFTVHCRVQVLQKRPASNPAVWNEGQDVVVSEYRGSSLVERYIDPSDPRLTGNWDKATMAVDFTQNVGSTTDANADLSQLYKFRVVNTKKFAP